MPLAEEFVECLLPAHFTEVRTRRPSKVKNDHFVSGTQSNVAHMKMVVRNAETVHLGNRIADGLKIFIRRLLEKLGSLA